MSNPFYSAHFQPNIMQILQQFKANPVQFLIQRHVNIPSDMAPDPQAILNHLLQTGQVSQLRVNEAYRLVKQMH